MTLKQINLDLSTMISLWDKAKDKNYKPVSSETDWLLFLTG